MGKWADEVGPDGLTFPARLKARRKAEGYRQEDLHAEMTGAEKGIASVVSKWETGDQVPNAESLVTLGRALRCNVHWLLTGEGAPDLGAELTLDVIRMILDPEIGLDMVEEAKRLRAARGAGPRSS